MTIELNNRRYCSDLSLEQTNETIILAGWIDTIRDHGQLLFMHLRDRSGVVQIVFNPEENKDLHHQAEQLRSEYCVALKGVIIERDDDAKNPHVPTGMLEVHVSDLILYNQAKTPPFLISEKSIADDESSDFNVDEDLRLTYRYLDPVSYTHLRAHET